MTLAGSLVGLALFAAQTPAEAASVDKAKPQETAAAPAPAPASDFAQEAQGTVGGLFMTGNVESLAARAGGYYQMKYLMHGLRFDGALGITSLSQDTDLDPANGFDVRLGDEENRMNTLANGRLRYDFFLTDLDSIYAATMGFHDSAANLQVRLRADAGYRRYFFHSPKHSFSGEIGAVYTIDRAPFKGDTNEDGLVDLSDEVSFEANNGTVGARLMLGYANALMDNLAFTTTLEVIPNIFPEVDAPYEAGDAALGIKARVDEDGDNKLGIGEATIAISNSTLTYSLLSNLTIGANLMLGWDNGAVARRNAYTNHDVALTFQLGYRFF
jgi:Protein of unknown function, DUF481